MIGVVIFGLTTTHFFFFETILHSYRKFESALLDPTFDQVDCDFSAAIACEEKKKNGRAATSTQERAANFMS